MAHLCSHVYPQVVSKFPEDTVAEHAELFLLPLVMRLVNEPSPRGRAAVAAALKALLGGLPETHRDTFVTFCKKVRKRLRPLISHTCPAHGAAAMVMGQQH